MAALVKPRSERIHWIDALKGLVVFGIALFHASLVFGSSHWVVNNDTTSIALQAFSAFTFQWGIALMFLLAGGGTWFALRARAPGAFLSERIRRLGLPLILGVLIISPFQWYIENTRSVDLARLGTSYLSFWFHLNPTWSPTSGYGILYHLWFLAHLLLISAITLPAAMWLRTGGGRRFVAWLGPLVSRRGGILLFAIPIAITQMWLHPKFPGYQDWADIAAWSMMYLAGFVIVSDATIRQAFLKQGWVAFVAGLSALAVMGAAASLMANFGLAVPLAYNAEGMAYECLRSLSSWAWVAFFVWVGMRVFDRAGLIANWGAEMAMPFYVLSHPVLVLVARYVVATDLDVASKFLLIAVPAIAITLVLCEGVRRSRVLCMIFGITGKELFPTEHRLRTIPA